MLEHSLALVVLNMLPGIGPGRKRLLVSHFGSPELALNASVDELSRLPGIGSHLGTVIHNWQREVDLEAELSLVRRAGAVILPDDDPVYPQLLREIHDPPICLYVLGDVQALSKGNQSIAVVGSRHTTSYGMRMADAIASSACFCGWTVVSGLARGIDTSAHEASLRARGTTVGVVGSGLLHIYPQENLQLVERIIAQGGAVISEFPMGYRPDRRSFPMRNRIISGLCLGTVVVQAGLQSGSLITAAQALDQGRTVFAVPGPADMPQSHGCHALIRDGARLVEAFEDVLDEFSEFTSLRRRATQRNQETDQAKSVSGRLKLTGLELKLMDLLGNEEKPLDELIEEAEEEASSVMACLLTLELRRLVRQLPGKRIVRVYDG